MRAPQDEVLFRDAAFFVVLIFFATGFLATAFLTATFSIPAFAAFRAFGRFFSAARCAAASAVLAHAPSSSESSNNRAGNSQYEFTVTVLARVWY